MSPLLCIYIYISAPELHIMGFENIKALQLLKRKRKCSLALHLKSGRKYCQLLKRKRKC